MSWEIFDRIYSGHWFLLGYHAQGFVYDFPRLGGGSFINQVVALMKGGVCKYLFNSDEFNAAAEFAADRLLQDKKWRGRVYQRINFYNQQYFIKSEKFRQLPFSRLSDRELVKKVNQILPLQHYQQIYGVMVNGLIIDGKNHLSNRIREELKTLIGNDKNFNNHWALLTLPNKPSFHQKKDYEIAKLALLKNGQKITRGLSRLHKRYCWLNYLYLGPPASLDQFKTELKMARQKNININLFKQLKLIGKKQNNLIKKLGLGSRAKVIIKIAQQTIWNKGLRKDIMSHGFYCYEPFWRELARRKKITNWKLLTFLCPWEIENFILKNTPKIHELKNRRKYSCLIINKKITKLLLGIQAHKFFIKLVIEGELLGHKEIKGQGAYPGIVRGIVRIIQIPADMKKMKNKNILVSQATSPDLLPAMRKAAAIVTNKGGLICHAAITARELKIPCIVGTNNATLILNDGDLVEVDANKGIVRIIK